MINLYTFISEQIWYYRLEVITLRWKVSDLSINVSMLMNVNNIMVLTLWTGDFKLAVELRLLGLVTRIRQNTSLCATQRTSLTDGVQGPLQCPGSSTVLNVISWYLSLILKHSDIKLDRKYHSRSKFKGGAHLLHPPPLWIRHCIVFLF